MDALVPQTFNDSAADSAESFAWGSSKYELDFTLPSVEFAKLLSYSGTEVCSHAVTPGPPLQPYISKKLSSCSSQEVDQCLKPSSYNRMLPSPFFLRSVFKL